MRVLSCSVVALFAALSPQVAAAADGPLGRWHGTYDCQKVTATADVDIWEDETAPGGMRGRFAFAPGPSGQGATGSYWVTVETQSGGWKLVPDQWEYQPEGYGMVGASLFLLRDNLRGLIEHPVCMGAARVISLDYVGESTIAAAPAAPAAPQAAVNQGPYKYEQPDYMKRAEEARKAQNAANCERASKGASVYCEH